MKQLLLSGLLLAVGPAAAQSLSFAAPVLYSFSQGSSGPLVCDVNGDGQPDLVQLAATGSAITVRLNTGAGTFATTTTSYPSGSSSAITLAAGDVNADGKPDIGLVSRFARTLSILLGTGSGGFQAATSYALPASPQPGALLLADVNNDGRADALVVGNTPSAVGVLLSQSTGGFAPVVQYSPTSFTNATVADLNGDGRLDLLFGGNSLTVWLGNGAGAFAPATPVSIYGVGSTAIQQIQVGDVNNDGRPDVVVLNTPALGSTTSQVNVLLGTGNGSLGAATAYTLGNSAYGGIVLSDLNKDGWLDIATTFGYANTVGVLLNQANGTFPTATVQVLTGGSPFGLTAADVNGDAKPDLLTFGSSELAVLLNTRVLPTRPGLTAANVALAPNPAHGSFTVQVPPVAGATTMQLTLRTLLGQCVAQQTAPLPPAGASLTFPATTLAAGTYLLHVQAGDQVLLTRVAIE